MGKSTLTLDNWNKIPPELADLSPSRQRKIMAWADQQRADATMVAVEVCCKTMNEVLGIGLKRLRKLLPALQRDIEGYYDEREVRDRQIREWLYEIGFIVVDGVIKSVHTDDGSAIHPKTVGWDIDGNGMEETAE